MATYNTHLFSGPQLSRKVRDRAWIDDESLWRDFQQGDIDAYAVLYRTYSPTLYDYGRHLGGDHGRVKDCIQELFEQLWNTKSRLARVKAIRQYLVKSFRRMLLRTLTQERRYAAERMPSDFCLIPSAEADLIERQTSQAQKNQLLAAMNQLSVQQREVLYLKFYQNLSYPDIATAMKTSVSRVYNLVSRAIRRLKLLLKSSVYCLALLLGIF